MRLIPHVEGSNVAFETGMRIKAVKDLLDLPDDYVLTMTEKGNLGIMKEDGLTYLGFIDLENENRILFDAPEDPSA